MELEQLECQWIAVRNWSKFQHYHKERPRWIKLYRDLLHDAEFMSLSPANQALLVKLWLLHAETAGRVPLDTRLLSRWTNQAVRLHQLETLNHAGFIEFNSRAEVEREVEIEQDKLDKPASKSPFQAPATALLRRVV